MKRAIYGAAAPRRLFDWNALGRSGTIPANTRSEARALLKRELGLRRLPFSIVLILRQEPAA